MHKVMVFIAVFASVVAGCGAETANTAATVAGLKKLGIEDGKKSMEQAQTKVESAVAKMNERAEKDAAKESAPDNSKE
jgi:hypothetical protein